MSTQKGGDTIKESPYAGFEVIATYSRAEAISDGVLIDVFSIAREAGITFPVAVTNNVWAKYVTVPAGVIGQDEQGRLWDIIWMLKNAILQSKDSKELSYGLYVRNNNRNPKFVYLKAVCGPGDNGEPVINVMLPEED